MTDKLTEIGDAMAVRLASLAQTLRERGYDDAPQIEKLVEAWRREREEHNTGIEQSDPEARS